MFHSWLAETGRLQIEAFGVNYEELRSDPDQFANYIMYNLFAAHDEVSEIAGEVGWKPWSKTRGWYNKEEVKNELVDVLHFLANVAVACGITDKELDDAYVEKMQINRRRQSEGYEQRNNNAQ